MVYDGFLNVNIFFKENATFITKIRVNGQENKRTPHRKSMRA